MMMGMYENTAPIIKLLIFIGVLLLCTAIFSLAGLAIAPMIFGSDAVRQVANPDSLSNPQSLAALKFLQIFSQIGVMIVPALIAGILFSKNTFAFLHAEKNPGTTGIVLVCVLMIAAAPMLNFFIELNSEMKLPAFLQNVQDWMERYEKEAAALTDAFLKMDSKKDLFINLFMVGLLPAIGEEFLFRGVIQKLLRQMTGNAHSAIIITAILFSAIHMQFFGFVPRFLLGAFFGYLLYWSGSIWLPVTAHFVNNGMAVIFSWYQQRNQLPFNPDTVGTEMRDWWIVLLSTVTVVVIAFNLKRKYR